MAYLPRFAGADQRFRTGRQASGASHQLGANQPNVAGGQCDSSVFAEVCRASIYPNEVLLPTSVAGLQVDSIALCYQIRTLDKSRLEQDLGELVEANLCQEILEAIRFQLDL